MTCPSIQVISPQDKFLTLSLTKNVNALASYLPGGELYRAKNIENSVFRDFLSGICKEIIRVEEKIKRLADDYYIWTTFELISEWERAVGIPDDCFSTEVSLEQRRKQVIAKLALMNLQTRDDFICLAAFFGYTINIYNGSVFGAFPAVFPILLVPDALTLYNTIVIEFIGIEDPNVFPLQFPIQLGTDETSFLKCLFEKQKPIQTQIVYIYA